MASNKSVTIDKKMFYGASALIINRAYELRPNPTDAEKHLWHFLKNNQIQGLRFRRQHPISSFIVDFYCHKTKLVIKIDGKIHSTQFNKEHDDGRTYEIEKFGITVIRFTNEAVFHNLNHVISEIRNKSIALLENQGFSSSPPSGGRGH